MKRLIGITVVLAGLAFLMVSVTAENATPVKGASCPLSGIMGKNSCPTGQAAWGGADSSQVESNLMLAQAGGSCCGSKGAAVRTGDQSAPKACKPGCQKACCAGTQAAAGQITCPTAAKMCPMGAQKACCAKASVGDATAQKECPLSSGKTCCGKEVSQTKTCKPGCPKPCCAKS